ncbi:MAG: DUF4403 family protein [Flavobacteriales bacterium]
MPVYFHKSLDFQGAVLRLICLVGAMCMGLSCKRINPEPPDYKLFNKQVEKKSSFISIPVELPVKLIEDYLNQNFKGEIYTDDSYTQPVADDLKLKVWIRERIVLTAKDAGIHYTIPLKIWGQGRWRACEFCPELEKQTAFDVDVFLKTSIEVLKNYKIQSSTQSDGFVWKSTPKISFGPFNISIAPIVERAISDQLGEISKEIDKNINRQADLRSHVNDLWAIAQQPYLIDEESNSWMSIQPSAIYLSPIESRNQAIFINLGLECIIDARYGSKPLPKSVSSLPDLKFTQRKSDAFTVNITSSLSFYDAGVMAGMAVKGMEMAYKQRKIVVRDLEIFGKGELAYVRVAFDGSAKGNIYLYGKPRYESEKNLFYFENLDYDIKTRNILLRSADWLANDLIRKKLGESLRFSFEDEVKTMRTGIAELLKEYKYEDLFVLRGKLKSFKVDDIIVAEDRFDILLYADGHAKLIFTNIKF